MSRCVLQFLFKRLLFLYIYIFFVTVGKSLWFKGNTYTAWPKHFSPQFNFIGPLLDLITVRIHHAIVLTTRVILFPSRLKIILGLGLVLMIRESNRSVKSSPSNPIPSQRPKNQ